MSHFLISCGGIVVEQSGLGHLRAEVLELIFNDWLLRKFRGNLRRMDRANSLELMLRDLEMLTAPTGEPRRAINALAG
jgi:UDP-N-acetylglucosamine--N-acetylmuramyl-(pentapeptide) pyrophosphoryl-undecaprenol N-acetylglucosamine transferase